MPPEGKLEASGSPWISCLPVNSAIAPPVAVGRQEAVVLLGRQAGQRVEDVGVVRGALFDRPILHRRGDDVGHASDRALRPTSIVFFSDLKTGFGQPLLHLPEREDVGAEDIVRG